MLLCLVSQLFVILHLPHEAVIPADQLKVEIVLEIVVEVLLQLLRALVSGAVGPGCRVIVHIYQADALVVSQHLINRYS